MLSYDHKVVKHGKYNEGKRNENVECPECGFIFNYKEQMIKETKEDKTIGCAACGCQFKIRIKDW